MFIPRASSHTRLPPFSELMSSISHQHTPTYHAPHIPLQFAFPSPRSVPGPFDFAHSNAPSMASSASSAASNRTNSTSAPSSSASPSSDAGVSASGPGHALPPLHGLPAYHLAAGPKPVSPPFSRPAEIPTPPASAELGSAPMVDCKAEPVVPKRKHACKTCGRSFTTSGHLARHNRTHTGERKHMCPFPQCGARFARQDNCMQHYKMHLNGKSKRRGKRA
ncbi:hypothetical protein CLUG_05697 [Clavispora lusitaniae ATCC 42720]|uniref:C2H2-type domain-containing protein n=1 Tax=Clavispora lusitaniae (strain ATCC 42720) TaxID=306902 RepID=C4YBW9_CLAL4|nr:uncharacterized protein CLUG_05697 [Clavispora lusitaniae ATCC 42720]EEQ41570.1 hypothetical protein CLUG_05697 [Clavispora lusitaniae ATCC 42720]